MDSIKVVRGGIYSASLKASSDKICERETDTWVFSSMDLHMSSTYEGSEINHLMHTKPTVP